MGSNIKQANGVNAVVVDNNKVAKGSNSVAGENNNVKNAKGDGNAQGDNASAASGMFTTAGSNKQVANNVGSGNVEGKNTGNVQSGKIFSWWCGEGRRDRTAFERQHFSD